MLTDTGKIMGVQNFYFVSKFYKMGFLASGYAFLGDN